MSMFARVAVVAASVLASGCAIRPLPDDVTGASTHTIVRQIRCETRQAVIDSALGWLTSEENLAKGRVDSFSHAVGREFVSGRPIQQFEPKLFRGRVRMLVQLFYDTGVAYNFDLEMTEVNNLNTEINLLKPFTSSKFTLGIKGNFDRQRKNQRLFTITDTFSSLIRLPTDYCDGRSVGEDYNFVVSPNYIYPIAGRIGTKRMVQDFINLTLFDNLGGRDDKVLAADKAQGPPTMVDQLSFMTTIGGSLAPKIVFTPVGQALQVTDAALTGAGSRTDLHKVTMGLAITTSGIVELGPARTTLFGPVVAPLVSARPTTRNEAAAVAAVNQALMLQIFRPTIVVAP